MLYPSLQPVARAQNAPLIRHGRLPSNDRYWQFNRWYLDHSVTHLIVSGTDPEHLADALEEVEKLVKKNVAIGKIFVIGAEGFSWFDGTPDQPKVDRSRASGTAAKLGLGSGTAVGKPQELLKNLDIQNSPTWVVRYQGKDYIYEGFGSISRYFSSQGQFLGAQK